MPSLYSAPQVSRCHLSCPEPPCHAVPHAAQAGAVKAQLAAADADRKMLRARCSQLQAEACALSRKLDAAGRQPEQQWRAGLVVSAELTAVRQEAAEARSRGEALEQTVQAVQAVSGGRGGPWRARMGAAAVCRTHSWQRSSCLSSTPSSRPPLPLPQELSQLRGEKLSLQSALQASEDGASALAAELQEARRAMAAAQAEVATERQRRQAVESSWAAAQDTLRSSVRALSEHHGSLASLQSHLAASKQVRGAGVVAGYLPLWRMAVSASCGGCR